MLVSSLYNAGDEKQHLLAWDVFKDREDPWVSIEQLLLPETGWRSGADVIKKRDLPWACVTSLERPVPTQKEATWISKTSSMKTELLTETGTDHIACVRHRGDTERYAVCPGEI